MKRTPIALPVIHDPARAGTLRRLDCRHQSACNAVACNRDWDSWGCGKCEAFAPLTDHEQERDRLALLEMIAAVFRSASSLAPAPRKVSTVRVAPGRAVVVCRCGKAKHPRARLCDPCRYAVVRRAG